MSEVSRLMDAYAAGKTPRPAEAHEEHSHRCETCGGDLPEEILEEEPKPASDPDTKAALYVQALRERKS